MDSKAFSNMEKHALEFLPTKPSLLPLFVVSHPWSCCWEAGVQGSLKHHWWYPYYWLRNTGVGHLGLRIRLYNPVHTFQGVGPTEHNGTYSRVGLSCKATSFTRSNRASHPSLLGKALPKRGRVGAFSSPRGYGASPLLRTVPSRGRFLLPVRGERGAVDQAPARVAKGRPNGSSSSRESSNSPAWFFPLLSPGMTRPLHPRGGAKEEEEPGRRRWEPPAASPSRCATRGEADATQ